MNDIVEKIFKDMPSEDDTQKLAESFASFCSKKNLFCVCSITAPMSEYSHSGICCDVLIGNFLLSSLLKQLADDFGVSVETFVASLVLSTIARESGALDDDAHMDFDKYKHTINHFKKEIDKIYRTQLKSPVFKK